MFGLGLGMGRQIRAAAGGGGGGGEALVDLDFVNGAYTISAASVALTDCLWGDPDYYGAWNSADVVAGIGLRATHTTTGVSYGQTAPGFTAAVKAQMVGGWRMVIDYSTNLENQTAGLFQVSVVDDNNWLHGVDFTAVAENNHPNFSAYANLAGYDGEIAATDAPSPGDHTLTIRNSGGTYGIALDAAAEASDAENASNAGGVAGMRLTAYVSSSGASVTSTVVVKRIRLYADGR